MAGGARLAVAGLSGDSGKTLVTLGLARALVGRGLKVRAFKKGPDYIDAAWLRRATGAPCRNLDTFLMPDETIRRSVAAAAAADLVLIEGNRGLFDGVDSSGTHSTAALVKLLRTPIVLVVNVTKVTRTAAAMVLGCQHLDPEVNLAGVVLNEVATSRQEAVVRQAVEEATDIPVVGAIPRMKGGDPLPGRHLGLVTVVEHPDCEGAIKRAARAVAEHVDVDRVLSLAHQAKPLGGCARQEEASVEASRYPIGYFADEAFSFYYPENLESLERAGARLVAIRPQTDTALPEVEGLYIGGGFPEVHAGRLADNRALAEHVRASAADGLPIYAECGGLMYLARELVVAGSAYQMAGVLDLVVEQADRPQGHGYEVARVDCDNPFYATGTEIRGHEFHYSRVDGGLDLCNSVLALDRGTGIGQSRDGIVKGHVWASYLHLHASTMPSWSQGFMNLVGEHSNQRHCATAMAWD
jgi:cobyrinic acid a,c-diamide synthase